MNPIAYHLCVQSDQVVQADAYGPGGSGPERVYGQIDPGPLKAAMDYLPLLEEDTSEELKRETAEKIGELLYRGLFSGKIAGHFELDF